MTVAQAASRAAVCKSLVYGWCADGSLPHVRLGRKGSRGVIRISAEDLDQFLDSFKVGPRPTSAAAKPRAVKLNHLVID